MGFVFFFFVRSNIFRTLGKDAFRGGRHEVRDYGKVGLGFNSTFGPLGLNFVHDRHFLKSLTKRPGHALAPQTRG